MTRTASVVVATSFVMISACDSVKEPTAVAGARAPQFHVATASTPERPFRGRIRGRAVVNPTSDPVIWIGGAQASGVGTHIGAFSKITSDVTNLATGELTGSFTMTVANGDLITGTYAGILTFANEPGKLSWRLNAIITGGTGRFVHATGAFVFVAEGDYASVNGGFQTDYTETFDGTIRY